jgi:mRNA-degrading endonuclease RelE of RelBE toxin-antitoxin system
MAGAGRKERAVEQSTRFGKAKRRLPPKSQLALDDEVRKIVDNPLIGELKMGALKGVRVLKFKLGPLQLLLAYEFDGRRNLVELLDVGPHENFYRDLESYLKERW